MKEITYTVKVDANGNKFWYVRGKLHREDGPAVEWADGTKFWYVDGKLHVFCDTVSERAASKKRMKKATLNKDEILGLAAVMGIGAIVAFGIMIAVIVWHEISWRSEAVKKGHAHYDPVTSRFEWNSCEAIKKGAGE